VRGASVAFALLASLPLAEGLIRAKNHLWMNYNVEMLRYSNELKRPTDNPILGHEHVANKSAILQRVAIRINEWGMRGGPVPSPSPDRRRILLLGSSITLGWGVEEEQTLAVRLVTMFRQAGVDAEVLNAGIGNYNAVRYVELFMTKLHQLQPTDVVVHYFINDAETLERGGGNALLRHSQLAAALWTLGRQQALGAGQQGMLDYYRNVYDPAAPGYRAMRDALGRLSAYAAEHQIRIYLAVTPDVHNLIDYPFGFIHERMAEIADELGYNFVDLYPGFRNLTPGEVWSMPGDPHPNALGHRIMAEWLFPALTSPSAAQLPAGSS
jgi:lysophospholipase L1-like esterase